MLSLLVKKDQTILNDSPVCNIHIEKSYRALELEKALGVDWGFDDDNPLDTFFYLRACLSESVTIAPRQIIPIPTGIYPHIISPKYELEVRSFSTLVYQYGLAVADGVSCFNYGFRNEIWVLIENKNDQAQIIQPAQKIALLAVTERPRMVIKYVDEIEKIEWKTRSQGYIQKIKRIINKSVNPLNPNRFKEKTEKFSEGYSRAEIELIMKDNKDESDT
jgi:dUTP pyrophosphatase